MADLDALKALAVAVEAGCDDAHAVNVGAAYVATAADAFAVNIGASYVAAAAADTDPLRLRDTILDLIAQAEKGVE
jgi:hypothetical protein